MGPFSDPDEEPMLWLTTNVLYAIDDAVFDSETISGRRDGKVYVCNFSTPYDVFNANNHRDYIRMIRTSGDDDVLTSDRIRALQRDDWFDQDKEFRKRVVKYARKIGYEGVFNYEHGPAYAPSIGLFDTSNLEIKRVVPEEDFSSVFKNQLENGDRRVTRGLAESCVVSGRRARELMVPLSMLREASRSLEYLEIT
jgi:hypothetical protein